MTFVVPGSELFQRARRVALGAAGVGLVAGVIGWMIEPGQFYRSYLFAYLFWIGLSLGCLAIVMLHHLMGGDWGACVRRFAEAGAMVLPIMVILFVPIALGLRHLYPWARPEEVAHDAVLKHKEPWLNVEFFLLRVTIYGLVWVAMSWRLWSGSLSLDREPDGRIIRRLHSLSAGGMLVYFITMSLATVDWIMSREPHWYSTIMGFQVICGQGVTAVSFLILVLISVRKQPPFREFVRREHFNDLGNLLLTLVILWTYMSFVQLLICWMGNKQDEISWYLQRLNNGWWGIGIILVLFHFLVPFFTLLIRDAKRNVRLMTWLCSALLFLRLLDLFFMIAPSGPQTYPIVHQSVSWLDLVLPIGLGGTWLSRVFLVARRQAAHDSTGRDHGDGGASCLKNPTNLGKRT